MPVLFARLRVCFCFFRSQFRICKLCLAVLKFLCDMSCYFQRILSLETLLERNNQQLLAKEQELKTLRQQLTARGGEVSMLDISLQHFVAFKKYKCTLDHNMKIFVNIKKAVSQS